MLVKNHGGIEAAQQPLANDTPTGLHNRPSLHWSTDFSKLQCSYSFPRLLCSRHHYLNSFRLLQQSHHNWFSSQVQMHFWMDNYTDEPVSNETRITMPPAEDSGRNPESTRKIESVPRAHSELVSQHSRFTCRGYGLSLTLDWWFYVMDRLE